MKKSGMLIAIWYVLEIFVMSHHFQPNVSDEKPNKEKPAAMFCGRNGDINIALLYVQT